MNLKINSDEIKGLLAAINILIEIKVLIREITPNYNLNNNSKYKLKTLLKSLELKLQPIFSKYLLQENFKVSSVAVRKDIRKDIEDLIQSNVYILISANSSKKKLKKLGIDPRNFIVTGGPLFPENYKRINPSISNTAFLGIKTKCDALLNQIRKSVQSGKEIIFLYEKTNITDEIILEELKNLISDGVKNIKTYEIGSWNYLDN